MTYHSNQKENISQNNNSQGFYQNGSVPPKGTKNTVIIVIVAVCCLALGVTVGVTGMIFKTKIVDNVMERINTSRPYIGVTVKDVDMESQNLGIPQGAVVISVAADGPAKKADIKEYDIITKINGDNVKNVIELRKQVSDLAIGDKAVLTVYRQGNMLELEVKIENPSFESQDDNELENNEI